MLNKCSPLPHSERGHEHVTYNWEVLLSAPSAISIHATGIDWAALGQALSGGWVYKSEKDTVSNLQQSTVWLMPQWIEAWGNYRKEEGGLPRGGDSYLAWGNSITPLYLNSDFYRYKSIEINFYHFYHHPYHFRCLQNFRWLPNTWHFLGMWDVFNSYRVLFYQFTFLF